MAAPLLGFGTGWQAWFPRWVQRRLPPDVQEMVDNGTPCTMFHVSGPAIKEIWWVTPVLWFFAVVFPFAVDLVSSCPHSWHPFAHYPTYVWWPFLALVAWTLYREARCLRWVIYTQVLYCAPFRILGREVSFNKWLAIMLVLGLASHADIATNGLFMSKILKNVGCNGPATRTIQDIWASVIQQSIVSGVPGVDKIRTLLVFCWGIMFLQPLLALLAFYPVKGVRNTNYNKGVGAAAPAEGEMNGYVTPLSWFQQWTGSDPTVHHADVFKWLAAVNRMISPIDRTLLWTVRRGEEKLRDAKRQKGARKLDSIRRLYDMISREFSFSFWRLLLINLLEKSCMLEAQTTVFAISRCMMPPELAFRFDPQMLLSVFLSFVTSFKTIYDAVDQLDLVWSHWSEIAQEDPVPIWSCLCFRSVEEGVALEIVGKRRRLYLQTLSFVVVTLCLIWVTGHCLLKFGMAFWCRDSLWNIPFHEEPHVDSMGCVDLRRFLDSLRHSWGPQ